MNKWQSFSKFLLQLTIFLIPIQLGYHFWPNWAHVFGIRVDYFSPTVYLTDILIFLLVVARFPKMKLSRLKPFLTFLAVILFVLANIYLGVNRPLAIYRWAKVGELALFSFAIISFSRAELKSLIQKPLLFSLAFFSAIGISQFILGHSLGGWFYYLGERTFSLVTPGIALAKFGGTNFLRAYSTFSHPNALAGYLIVALMILIWSSKAKLFKSWSGKLIVGVIGLALLTTFSLTALLALIVALCLRRFVKRVSWQKMAWFLCLMMLASLLFSIVGPMIVNKLSFVQENLWRRVELAKVAGQIFSKYPLFGAGGGGFIWLLPVYGATPSISWWLQPVHNIFLLVLSETGLTGLLLLFYVFLKAFQRIVTNLPLTAALAIVIITGGLDHYWLTLQQNQILFALLLALSFV